MRLLSRTAAWVFGAALLVVLGTGQARAALIVYKTASGATNGLGNPVSTEADITTGNGVITITLKDLLANPNDVGQLLSDFKFTVGNGGSLTSSSETGATAGTITVNSNNTITPGSTLTTPAQVGWIYSFTSTVGTLDVLAAGGAGPSNLIIGPPAGGGTYANANGSIAGNGPHNPFINQSATFTITAPGVTANTTITAATFSFGTTSGDNVAGVLQPATVPEPATLGMGLFAVVAGVGYAWRSRRRTAA